MRPTHVFGRQLGFNQTTYLNLFLPKNIVTETPQIMVDRISGHCGPAKFTCKINHQNRVWAYDLILIQALVLEVSTMECILQEGSATEARVAAPCC